MLKMLGEPGNGVPTATDQAYSGIIELVLRHDLRPGERTSVNLLAKRLGLGRTPIKEAITRLQTEGLLSVSGRSGTTVNLIECEQAEQLFALRQVLEDFAAEGAVKHATSEQIRRVKELAREMRRQSLDKSDAVRSAAGFISSNVEFHATIIAATGNRFLLRLYSQIQMQMQIVTYLVRSGYDPKAAERRQSEHDAIAKALADRDAKQLKSALRSHAQTTSSVILATLTAESKLRSSDLARRKNRVA
jgi:DNA-binding GntR family transcriptional regulator